MKIKLTEGGIRFIEFADAYESSCSLLESGWEKRHILFGHEPHLCLSQERVKELLPYLQRFVAEGELFSDEEKALVGTGEAIASE